MRVTGNNQTCAVLRLSPTLRPPIKACDTPANTCPRTFPTWSGFPQLGGFQLVRGFLNRIIRKARGITITTRQVKTIPKVQQSRNKLSTVRNQEAGHRFSAGACKYCTKYQNYILVKLEIRPNDWKYIKSEICL